MLVSQSLDEGTKQEKRSEYHTNNCGQGAGLYHK